MRKIILVCALIGASIPLKVQAQEFTIDELTLAPGVVNIEQNGFLARHLPDDEAIRTAHQTAIRVSPVLNWQIDAEIYGERLDGEAFEISSVGGSVLHVFAADTGAQLYAAAFVGAELSLRGEPAEIVTGLRFQSGGENTAHFAILNVALETPAEANEHSTLVYGMKLRQAIGGGVSLGVEAFGEVDGVFRAAPFAEQDHRVGPAIHIDFNDDDADDGVPGATGGKQSKRETLFDEMNLALLFGVTHDAPDISLAYIVEWNF